MLGLGKEITVSVYILGQPADGWGDPTETLDFEFTAYKQPFSGDGNYRNDQYFKNVRDLLVCYDTTIALTKGKVITYEGSRHTVEYIQPFESLVGLNHLEIFTSDKQSG